MGDREARILAAGEKITVNNKEYMLRPVVAQQLCDLERDALRYYKREVIATYVGTADLIPDGIQRLRDKQDEVSLWGLDDLPQKKAYNCAKVPVTDELRKFLSNLYDELPDGDLAIRVLLNHALDKKQITTKEVESLCGKLPLIGKIRYDQWWVTGASEGMVAFVFSSLKHDQPSMSIKEVMQWPFQKIIEAAGIVEHITVADLGNM